MAGSMRETVKALTVAFSAPTVSYPLPDELHQTIDAFLHRYQDIEEHDSQRLHEELLSLYMRHVAGSREKHGPFLRALRLLRPTLTGEARLNEWWELVLRPTIDSTGHKRHEIEDARDFLQSILVFDVEEDKDEDRANLAKIFTKKILDAYLARMKIPFPSGAFAMPEDEFISRELENILVAFGRKRPKDLLLALDGLLVQKQYRIQALNLLTAFLRLQPPHLYTVLETPLLQHLEKCLLIDTSATVIELALIVLIMFLPHITASLRSDHHFAKLFLIYSRLLCWDKIENATDAEESTEGQSDAGSEADDDTEQAWEKIHNSLEYPDTSPPTLLHYFTFLYGLFPLNFMSFIRKPRKYLKGVAFPGADDFDLDQDLIHSRTEPYRRVHLLHPNMFTTTFEDELNENRWLKSDPADVVTECMDLCVAVSTTLDDPGLPPTTTTKLADLPASPIPGDGPRSEPASEDDGTTADDSAISWRNTQSSMYNHTHDSQPDSFEIPLKAKSVKSAKSSKSASPLLKCQDITDSPTLGPKKEEKKQNFIGVPITIPANSANPTRLEDFALAVTTWPDSSTSPGFQDHNTAALQREIMLLRNDLNFERYLKLQHLAHIGQLQRKHVREATAEAETQNLINTNRTLKAKLAKANELYAQLKKETLTSRSQSKKWESELSSKVRSYREDKKMWQVDEDRLRFDLRRAQEDCKQLKKTVERAESEQLKAQQRTRALEFELEDFTNVQSELKAAQEKMRTYEDQSEQLIELIKERDELRNELEVTKMKLNSRQLARDRSIQAYERRIMDLESRLQAADKNPSNRPSVLPPSVQQMLDSTLAANNAKLQQMKKTHYRLLEQYTELEMKYHDLEGERQAEIGRLQAQEKDSLRPNFSFRQQSSVYRSKYPPPLSAESPSEEYDHHADHNSQASPRTPATISPGRPVRLDSIPQQTHLRDTIGMGHGPDSSALSDASLNAQLHSQQGPDSSTMGMLSVETSNSKGEKKDKVDTKSEVRVYGRGGAQNIGKKVKDKEPKKAQPSKTGGFRGLKGIM